MYSMHTTEQDDRTVVNEKCLGANTVLLSTEAWGEGVRTCVSSFLRTPRVLRVLAILSVAVYGVLLSLG